ncbi:SurA N-terminal domain-containing protein [Rhodanobacter sp. DHB23]|uniref:SurA N-terminal domain-containing protein n=1 Tax=Rhodanobacter sp. DHB23 TaxID=2775923 RepID=UPI00177D8AC5|nr:SurA N-terminal domain-containing protein [Rhodanobacter sp. DHB23]MBD8873520.1 SurA N-terminal domain-containing protein [Rhodanobacter sp. DHB23]
MLQAIRNKMHGWPAAVLLGLATFAMSFFGIEGYIMSRADTYVAKVGKHEISQQDFQARMNQLRQQMSAEQGDSFDADAFEKPEMKQRVLDGMIDQQLLLKANEDWGVRVPDQAIRDYIAGIPAFQVNGQFDPNTYRTLLAEQRKTPDMFQDDVRASLATQALPNAVNASTIVTDEEMDHYLDLRMQRRDISYAVLPKPQPADASVTDVQIADYYKAHLADYMNPEQVSLQYIEVKGSELKPDAPPSDADLMKRYESEKQRFVQPEQREVSHILVNVPANATPDQQKAALAKVDKIVAGLTPDNFAKVAAQDSDDLGSKRQGGDLGWLQKGVTNAAFDTAMFALTKGEISKPVLTPDGYDILWLRDIRSGDAKSFAEVRDQLLAEATSGEKDRKYNEVAGKLSDNTYQNPSSLDPAAQALGLPIKTTPLFPRQGGEGITADPKVIKAAFGNDVLAQGNNSSLIELGNDDAVVIRVAQHVAAAAKPLAEVHDAIGKTILDQRITTAAKQQADALLARLRKGETLAAVAASDGASVKSVADVVRIQPDVPAVLRDQAFLLPHPADGKPQYAAVDMQDGSYALLAVDKVQGADLSKVTPDQRNALRQQMIQAYGAVATEELIKALRAGTEIKIAKDRM